MVQRKGKVFFVKNHFKSDQGIKNLTHQEAAKHYGAIIARGLGLNVAKMEN
ncbi:MAG: catalase [Desulfomonilaceae bacterium]